MTLKLPVWIRRRWYRFREATGGKEAFRNLARANAYLEERGVGFNEPERRDIREFAAIAQQGVGPLGCLGAHGRTLGERLWRSRQWRLGLDEAVRLETLAKQEPKGSPEYCRLMDESCRALEALP